MKTQPNSTVEQFKNFVRRPYAWPGGYPMFAVCDDGGCLCKDCAKSEAALIIRATVSQDSSGWQVAAVGVNWEDTELTCDHCGNAIESAYGD